VSPRFLRTLIHPDRRASVVNVRFFADGTRLFAAGYPSGLVQVFDTATGKEVRQIATPPGLRGTFDFAVATPDLRTLYVSVERRKAVASEKDGRKQQRLEYHGELLAWDIGSGKELPSLPPSAPGRGVPAVFMSPAGDKLVTVERFVAPNAAGLTDETVLWDLPTRTATVLGSAYRTAFSPDGRRLAVAQYAGGKQTSRLVVWDVATSRVVLDLKPTAAGRTFSGPAFSPDGKTLAIQDSPGRNDWPTTLRLYDVETRTERASFDSSGNHPFMYPTFSPDGRRLALTDFGGNLTVWDAAARKIEHRTPVPGLATGVRMAFSPDGTRLAVPTRPKFREGDLGRDPDPADLPQPRVLLFDLAGGGDPEGVVCPHGYGGGPVFSPDGKTLAVGGTGGVHLFDLSRK
jgi:WD40 repeat protein